MGKTATKPKAAKEKPKYVVRCKFGDTTEVFEIDLLDLTGEEEILVEEMFDRPMSQLWTEGWVTGSAKARVFLSYLARRRKESGFTHAQALSFDPQYTSRDEGEDGEKRPTDAPKRTGSQS